MNQEEAPDIVNSRELAALDFASYEAIVTDNNESFRNTGILESTGYQKVVHDERTVYMKLPAGRVPILAPLEYVTGYDLQRTQQLTGGRDVYLLTVPPAMIHEHVELPEHIAGAAILVESPDATYSEDRHKLPDLFSGKEATITTNDFIDPRAKRAGHETAWMGMYSVLITPVVEKNTPPKEIKQVFNERELPLIPKDGHSLFTRKDFIEHAEVKEAIWDLFKDRFGWLGDNHPVSMEDTKEMFEGLLLDENAFTSIRFFDGAPICAGIFIHGLNDCEWLSPKFLADATHLDDDKAVTPMYFPGVAAKNLDYIPAEKRPDNLMQGVVGFHCELAADTGMSYRLFFESSNLSSVYIPRMTSSYINNSHYMHTSGEIEQVDKLHYWFLKQD